MKRFWYVFGFAIMVILMIAVPVYFASGASAQEVEETPSCEGSGGYSGDPFYYSGPGSASIDAGSFALSAECNDVDLSYEGQNNVGYTDVPFHESAVLAVSCDNWKGALPIERSSQGAHMSGSLPIPSGAGQCYVTALSEDGISSNLSWYVKGTYVPPTTTTTVPPTTAPPATTTPTTVPATTVPPTGPPPSEPPVVHTGPVYSGGINTGHIAIILFAASGIFVSILFGTKKKFLG